MKTLKYFSLFLIILISCQRNLEKKTYYSSGELKQTIVQDNENSFLFTEYYQNGKKKSEGHVYNDNKAGQWKEWYIDGKIMWDGGYENNKRTINYKEQTPKITMNDSSLDTIYSGISYPIRINLNGVHPSDMIISSNNGNIVPSNDKDSYDYIITPQKSGILKIIVFVRKEGSMYKIGEKQLIIKGDNPS